MHEILSGEVFPDQRLPVAGERLELVADVAPHSHAFFEIAVVLAGRGIHLSAAGEVPLQRDSVVVLRPGEWHGYTGCDGLVVRNAYLGADIFAFLHGVIRAGDLPVQAKDGRHTRLEKDVRTAQLVRLYHDFIEIQRHLANFPSAGCRERQRSRDCPRPVPGGSPLVGGAGSAERIPAGKP